MRQPPRRSIAFKLEDTSAATWTPRGFPVLLSVAVEQEDGTFEEVFTGDYDSPMIKKTLESFVSEWFRREEVGS